MRVNVHFGSRFSALTGSEALTIELTEQATVGELLTAAVAECGEALRKELIGPAGGLASGIVLSINGAVRYEPCEAALVDGDEVLVFSAISGG